MFTVAPKQIWTSKKICNSIIHFWMKIIRKIIKLILNYTFITLKKKKKIYIYIASQFGKTEQRQSLQASG